MIDVERPAHILQRTRVLSLIATAFLSFLLAWLSLTTVKVAIASAPSFDGAMNLEVAHSISEGDGFRRTYGARDAFPHEIQTGAPYILPAALVFNIFGVGIVQAQIVNIAYYFLLLTCVYLLVRRLGGRAWGLVAACTVCSIPGMLEFGFNGYGEIPSLAIALLATVVSFSRPSLSLIRAVIVGALMALAVLTKTVMLIGAGALGLSLIAQCIGSDRVQRAKRLKSIYAIVAGGLITLVIMEIWRAHALGGLGPWRHWWGTEAGSIFKQAGVVTSHSNASPGLFSKFLIHLRNLGEDLGLPVWATAFWLMLLCICGCANFLSFRHKSGKWQIFAVLMCSLVYMAWWLLITPTAKAWHRRVIDGVICGDIGMLMLAAMWASTFSEGSISPGPIRENLRCWLTGLAALCVMAVPAAWVIRMLGEGHRVSNPSNAEISLQEVVRQVRQLPEDAYIFGLGWYSAPRVGLLSERAILDFNDVPEPRIKPGRPIYFVQEPGGAAEDLTHIRHKYDLGSTRPDQFALIPAEVLKPLPLSAKGNVVRRHIVASDNYPLMRGFNASEGSNGRWLTDDNLILLTPDQGDTFQLVIYTPPISSYLYKDAPNIIVSFNGCGVPPKPATPGALATLDFAVPPSCDLKPGAPVNVRIEVDNLLNVSLTRDPRALSVLGKQIGFVPSTP